MSLKNKKILITAGPTWVPLDDVRVISNTASGQTGILLASEAKRYGAQVTLILGPVADDYVCNSIKTMRFKYFDELRDIMERELRRKKYDIVIHSAAVSDFRPKQKIKGKLDSERVCNLKLLPLPKIIKEVGRIAPCAKLVMFKLELGVSDRLLIQRAKKAQNEVGASIVVANRLNPYRAFIINKNGGIVSAESKIELAKKLLKKINLTPNT
jgi:phosphopantothenoylcysteine decarboxylase/phosphopantothenate--cysteine ligase